MRASPTARSNRIGLRLAVTTSPRITSTVATACTSVQAPVRSGWSCIGGACTVVNCGDLTDCTGNLDCTDLSSDPNNCGDCGVVCPSGVCNEGGCTRVEATCGEGLAYCPAKVIAIGFNDEPYDVAAGCYDLFSDNIHCGECDITVPHHGPVLRGGVPAAPRVRAARVSAKAPARVEEWWQASTRRCRPVPGARRDEPDPIPAAARVPPWRGRPAPSPGPLTRLHHRCGR